MQRQMPYTFSYYPMPPTKSGKVVPSHKVIRTVMISLESSRSGKQVIRARGCWDGDLHTIVKDVPAAPAHLTSMSQCHFFWDWMRYATVLAICEIFLEDEIEYDDIAYFKEMLEKPALPITALERPDPEYFKQLESFANSIRLNFIDNGF